jgi:hypothetical protein
MITLRHLFRKPTTIFRLYLATVLLQFGILCFCSVRVTALDEIFVNANYWWGFLSSCGALTLVLREKLAHWKPGMYLGEAAAGASLLALAFDSLTSEPPLYAGAVFAMTALLFLAGGLLCARTSS